MSTRPVWGNLNRQLRPCLELIGKNLSEMEMRKMYQVLELYCRCYFTACASFDHVDKGYEYHMSIPGIILYLLDLHRKYEEKKCGGGGHGDTILYLVYISRCHQVLPVVAVRIAPRIFFHFKRFIV